jgi:phospholipase C
MVVLTVATFGACRPGAIDWGLDAVDHMTTPADDPTLGCGVTFGADATANRAACTYRSGTTADVSLGVGKDVLARIPIRHVLVLMKENRSFDHLFGKLHDLLPDVDPIPAGYTNPGVDGRPVSPSHAATTCIPFDPGHQLEGMTASVDDGRMDGFVRNAAASTGTDGTFAITTYDPTDLPFDYFLARTFAVGDRHFAPVVSGTAANRTFMMFGTPTGVVNTGISYPPPETASIFQLLMSAGFTWGAYTDGNPFSSTLGWSGNDPGVHGIEALVAALDAGTLPNVAFVDGIEDIEDDHPTADLQIGEAWLKRIYDHAVTSPQWQRLAIVYTYDEGGAFFDHVPPPDGCLPLPSRSPFTARGPRIPLVVISPWSRRGYVSHVVRDHTAITRFIEALFGLPALTARDANSDALLDMFDFSCGRDLSVPIAPAAGTGGCKR